MKELTTWIIISVLLFSGFVVTIGVGLVKQNKNLVIASVFVFLVCLLTSGITVYKFVTRSYTKISNYLKPRSGDEVYTALFKAPPAGCVKVLNYEDQVIPKIDYAIWLHATVCAGEVKRIISQHEYVELHIASKSLARAAEGKDWFRPEQLGDTVVVYDYKRNEAGAGQTIYTNREKTEVYCVDTSE